MSIQHDSIIQRLLDIMRSLRDPETGCPWDQKQTFHSIAPYTIEEAYEVVDAIEQGNYDELRKELGDLLLQVVYHSQIATEEQLFTIEDVVENICDKMTHRHPHVFGSKQRKTLKDIDQTWESLKAQERADKKASGVMDDIPSNLPALSRAYKIQKRAAQENFDWDNVQDVIDKVKEELQEVEDALNDNNPAAIAEEIGDLLFACVNLSRHSEVKAETALRAANDKFIRRFLAMSTLLAEDGYTLSESQATLLNHYWCRVKQAETQI